MSRIARRTADLIGIGHELRDDEIILDDWYHAGTCGSRTTGRWTVGLAHREEGAMEPEREFMGRKKAKLWTYLIFGTVLVLGVLAANFAVVNPDLTRRGVRYFLGLPVGAFPVITGIVGMLVYLLGLKIETDWPEALGGLLIAGAVAWAEFLIGWDRFVVGGLSATPYVIPLLTFLAFLMVGLSKSR